MPKRIALDYDDSQLRIVVANCNGSRTQVTDAQVIPIAENESVSQELRAYITKNNLQKTETLVAIGRGKAELRELQLPPVPDEELPDMVRFQAIRNFASASDRAIVDFLVTKRSSENISLIAAAVAPASLDQVRELCSTSDLSLKRVALRPLTAASLYLRGSKPPSICVMIDLLADDAEIAVARQGKVIFVRTVRLPSEDKHRSDAIASELRRTMVACGETSTPDRIIVWGTESVHLDDLAAIKESFGCEDVQAVDPFDLVSVQLDQGSLPEHVGRLAPLVGLLASDENAPETFIDFLNPRERPVEEPDRVRRVLMIAAPIAAVFLLGFFVYLQFASWDRKISAAQEEVNLLLPTADAAAESIARTEKIDQFLDADVNWLDEIKRVAEKIPPSDKLILHSISGTAEIRGGGGRLQLTGGLTDPGFLDDLQDALRDEVHSVAGKGSQQQKGDDAYNWSFNETIFIEGSDLRNTRYNRMAEKMAAAESETELESEKSDDSFKQSDPDSSAEAGSEPEASSEPEDAAPKDGESENEQPKNTEVQA